MITGEVYSEVVAALALPEIERKQRVHECALEILRTGRWCRLMTDIDTWRLAAADGIHYVDVPAPLFADKARRMQLSDDLKLIAFQKLCALLDPEVLVSYS